MAEKTIAQQAVEHYDSKSSPAQWATHQVDGGEYWGVFECADKSRFLVTYACNKAQLAN